MTSIPQEFDASRIPSLRPYLNSLLENGLAEHVNVKWGKGERYVIVKSTHGKGGTTLIKI